MCTLYGQIEMLQLNVSLVDIEMHTLGAWQQDLHLLYLVVAKKVKGIRGR